MAVPALLLAAAGIALSWAYPFGSQLTGGDWGISAYPMFRFNMDVFGREGVLPFWNPFIQGGITHLASFNVWALYPTELLALPFRPEPHVFYWLDTLLHMWLAGTGFYWWLRLRGMGRPAAFTGALVYMLGGRLFTLAGAGHMSWVRSYALFPWTFGFLQKGLGDGGFRWPLLAGAVQSLSIIATGIQFTVQALLIALGWFALRDLRAGASPGLPVRRAGQFAVFASVMAVLSAGVWLPGFEHFRQSLRADPAAMAPVSGLFNLTIPDSLSFFLPDIYGQWPVYWGPQPFGAASDYFGMVPMALAVLGIIALGRSGWRWLLLGGAGILLAFGPATPAGSFLQDLPLFSGFRAGLRWLFLPYMAGAVLSAHGWDFLVARRKVGAWVAGMFGAFTLACLILYAQSNEAGGAMLATPFARGHVKSGKLNPNLVTPGVEKALEGGILAGTSAMAVFLLPVFPAVPVALVAAGLWIHSAVDLVRAGSPYFIHSEYSYSGPDQVTRQILGAELQDRSRLQFRAATDEYPPIANIRMREGIQWIYGYHSLPLAGYFRVFEKATSPGGEKLLPLLNLKYAVMSRPRPEAGRVSGALPRVFLAKEAVLSRGIADALRLMDRSGWTPAAVPVEGPGAITGKYDARGAVALTWGRDDMEARVSARGPALVVFLESWFPAWKAQVDGKRVPILRAYGAFRAVAISAGEHRIRLVYDSWKMKSGLWLSLVAWVALLLAIPAIYRGKR